MPNPSEARELCSLFIKEMADNRKGYDDAGIARQILSDLDTIGHMRSATKRRLSHWCHTEGNPFKRGMPLAQRISMALEDRVIPRED
jgi:hypothetical protein